MRTDVFRFTALSLLATSLASAQPADHLKCYKIKDGLERTTYTADLGGLTAEPGCKIKVPARMACVPATKANVQPTPPGTASGGPLATAFACYKVICPKAAPPVIALNDQFGSRTAAPAAAKLLCAPIASTTTSSTPTTSTTSTSAACLSDGQSCLSGGDAACCSGCCGGCTGTCTSTPGVTCLLAFQGCCDACGGPPTCTQQVPFGCDCCNFGG